LDPGRGLVEDFKADSRVTQLAVAERGIVERSVDNVFSR